MIRFLKKTWMPLTIMVLLIPSYYLSTVSEEFQALFKGLIIFFSSITLCLMLIYDNDKDLFEFLKLWFEFHILKMHREPKPRWFYIRLLKKDAKMELLMSVKKGFEFKKTRWKRLLVKSIIEASGLYDVKFTGEYKNKARYTLRKEGIKKRIKGIRKK